MPVDERSKHMHECKRNVRRMDSTYPCAIRKSNQKRKLGFGLRSRIENNDHNGSNVRRRRSKEGRKEEKNPYDMEKNITSIYD